MKSAANQKSNFEFDEKELHGLTVSCVLGSGSYGTVCLCLDKNECAWAVKQVEIEDNEHQIYRLFPKHPNINSLYKAVFPKDKPYYYMIFPSRLCDAHTYYRQTAFTAQQRRILIVQLLNALEHIHDRLVTHGDIKSDNILISSIAPLTFQLSDFSLARKLPLFSFDQDSKVLDVLQLAAMAWNLEARMTSNKVIITEIHHLTAEKLAENQQLQKEIKEVSCEYTRQFFSLTLGAKSMEKVRSAWKLLKIFPASSLQGHDQEKFIVPPKSRSLRSESIVYKPIGVDDIAEKKIAQVAIQDPSIAAELQKKHQEHKKKRITRIKRENLAYRARKSRKLNLPRKKKVTRCGKCLKVYGASNKARHERACLEKQIRVFRKQCQMAARKVDKQRKKKSDQQKK